MNCQTVEALKFNKYEMNCRGSGKVVSMFACHSNYPILNPIFCKFVVENNKARVGSLKSISNVSFIFCSLQSALLIFRHKNFCCKWD